MLVLAQTGSQFIHPQLTKAVLRQNALGVGAAECHCILWIDSSCRRCVCLCCEVRGALSGRRPGRMCACGVRVRTLAPHDRCLACGYAAPPSTQQTQWCTNWNWPLFRACTWAPAVLLRVVCSRVLWCCPGAITGRPIVRCCVSTSMQTCPVCSTGM